jgi:hypothetical protein
MVMLKRVVLSLGKLIVYTAISVANLEIFPVSQQVVDGEGFYTQVASCKINIPAYGRQTHTAISLKKKWCNVFRKNLLVCRLYQKA